jgi:hypothetical protein
MLVVERSEGRKDVVEGPWRRVQIRAYPGALVSRAARPAARSSRRVSPESVISGSRSCAGSPASSRAAGHVRPRSWMLGLPEREHRSYAKRLCFRFITVASPSDTPADVAPPKSGVAP